MGGNLGFGKSDSSSDLDQLSKSFSNSRLFSSASSAADAGNQSAFGQNVWSPQGAALNNLYGNIGNLFNRTTQGMGQQIPGAVGQQQSVFDTSAPAWRNQLQGGAYRGMPLQSYYQNALRGGGNEQAVNEMIMGGSGNNYVDAMKDQLAADSDKRLGRSLALADLRAAGNQQSGSSRHGLLQARLAEDEQDRLGDIQTKLGYNTFDKDLDRKLGIAQRADQFDFGRLQNVSDMLGAQNRAMQGGLNFGSGMQNLAMGQFAPHMSLWQPASMYTQSIGQPTVLGSGTGSAYSSAIDKANANAIMSSSALGKATGGSDSKGLGFGFGK